VALLVSGLIVFLCIHIVPMNASLKRLLSADPRERLQARLAWVAARGGVHQARDRQDVGSGSLSSATTWSKVVVIWRVTLVLRPKPDVSRWASIESGALICY
jgi:hypothetical protein